jgi:hypothetical protein
MPDPRNVVDFEGLEPRQTATFIADNVTILYNTEAARAAAVGLAVNMSASQTVQLAGDGETVIGAIEKVEADGKVTVHTGPFVTFKGGTAAVLTPGTRIVGDLLVAAKGYIQTMAATTAQSMTGRGAIVDASDTASVKVLMY